MTRPSRACKIFLTPHDFATTVVKAFREWGQGLLRLATALVRENAALERENATLRDRIAELERSAALDSTTSSIFAVHYSLVIGMRGRRTISATRSGGIGALPGGRDLSRSKPLTPSCMNHSSERQTQVLDLPVSVMIDELPSPSSLFRMIRARQT